VSQFSRKQMAAFIKKQQDEVATVDVTGFPPKEAKRIIDSNKLTLSEIAAEEGHPDLAQQLRREIGD
jgi:hypothetical protein